MSAKAQPPPIYIGVFGGPRVGKSSFIREALSGRHAPQNLPPTNDVRLTKPLTIDGRQVVLVDTPSFYNRAIRNADSADILKRLAGFLTRHQQNGRRITAAIFIYPKASRPNAPWLVEDAQRNWPLFCQLVGESFFPNVVFASTSWSNPPTPDQLSRETQLGSQEPFRSRVQCVNWASGPSAQGALGIIRIAMKRPPRQLAIQHELVDRNLRLADTGIGRAVIANSKQTAQQLQAQGNAQGAQTAGMIEGKLHAGYQQEANRWPARPTRPQGSSSAPRPASKPAPRPGQKPVPRPAQPQPPRPAPAAGRPVQRPPAPVSRPNSFTQGQPIRQHGPVAAPPMSYQPGRVNNQTQMQQVQPIARPPMHVNHSSQSSVHNHYQTTHVHAPPNPHAPPPPGPIVQNNSTYYNYSYEEHTAPPRSHSPPSSNIGLAAGAGLVGGATLLYVTYEPSDNGDSYSDGNQWEDDPDLYIDDINMTEDDWNDQVSYTSDNLDSYGNDPSAYPADAGNTWDSQAPDPGYSAVAPGGGYSSGGDYSGGGGGSGGADGDGGCCDCDNCSVAIVTIVATVMVVVVMAVVTVVETMMIAVKWITYGFLL